VVGPRDGLEPTEHLHAGSDLRRDAALGFWTDNFQGAIHQLLVSRSGSGNDYDISAVKIYRDDNNNGTLEPKFDACISSATLFSTRITTVTLNDNLIVTQTTSYLFVTYDFSPSAVQATQGAYIRGPDDITPADGNMANFSQINSSTITVIPSADRLEVVQNDHTSGFSLPNSATQGIKTSPL